MDYEDYLALTYTPLKAIEALSDIIYEKCNEEWYMFSGDENRKNAESCSRRDRCACSRGPPGAAPA